MESIDYSELDARLDELEERYLPVFHPTADYTDGQVDDMRALRLLAHAEIEFFLERLCERLIVDLERNVDAKQSARGLEPRERMILIWAKHAVQRSREAVNGNNGVKGKDIRAMFGPLGFDEGMFESISPVFLDKMNDFGKRRGDVAHQSSLRATWSITAQGEKKKLDEIKEFMDKFHKLVQGHRLRALL